MTPFTPWVGALIFWAYISVLLLGLATGFIGLLPPRRKHALAIIGGVLNILMFLFIVMIIFARARSFN